MTLLTLKQTEQRLGRAPWCRRRDVSVGMLPPPLSVRGSRGYLDSEVAAVIAARAAGATREERKTLALLLIAGRAVCLRGSDAV